MFLNKKELIRFNERMCFDNIEIEKLFMHNFC